MPPCMNFRKLAKCTTQVSNTKKIMAPKYLDLVFFFFFFFFFSWTIKSLNTIFLL